MIAYTNPHYFIRDKAINFIKSDKIFDKDNLLTNIYLFYDNK